MMRKLKQLLFLGEAGWKGLKKAVFACTLSSLSLMLPFSVTVQVILELLKPLTGEEISWSRMWMLFGFGVLSFLLVFLCQKYDYKQTYVSSYSQSESNRLSVAGHMRRLPMSFFNQRDLSELSGNIMGDCTNIEQLMSSVIPQMCANILSMTLVSCALALFDWRMALALFCTLPASLLVALLSRKAQNRRFEKHVDAKRDASRQTQEYLEGIKVIKACGQGGIRYESLKKALARMRKEAMRVQLLSSTFTSVSTLLLQAGIGIVVFVGALLLTGGAIDFITLLMFLPIVVRIYGPILTVLTMLPDLMYVSVSSRRLRALMETPEMGGSRDIAIENTEIRFEDVSFRYNDRDVISHFSAVFPAQRVTAVIGPSGGGKSTLSRLAARFWDVQSGTVRFGGRDVKEMDPDTLMESMSFIFQDVILFQDTVMNNIRTGRMGATDEQVLAAAKAARCDDFVTRLPEGYDTLLGENGSTLSGGERQRLSIARALLKDAPVVLLDEATTSLDPENEVLVQQAISELVRGKTVIVIAHRLRTIAGADRILVLNGGTLCEQGTHEELMAAEGLYHRLFRLQQDSLNWTV